MLGSNLGDRIYLIDKAIDLIKYQIGSNIKTSSVYSTEPWGTQNPLPYLNAAISLMTSETVEVVLKKIMSIEKKLGRKRDGSLNAPRTIDIDIIFYENLIIKRKKLTIPHPRMHLRRFVLVPLNEIEPDFIHPEFKLSVGELLKNCPDDLSVNIYKTENQY